MELLNRHAETSELRAELESLIADVRSREEGLQKGIGDMENMLSMIERAAFDNDIFFGTFSPQMQSEKKTIEPGRDCHRPVARNRGDTGRSDMSPRSPLKDAALSPHSRSRGQHSLSPAARLSPKSSHAPAPRLSPKSCHTTVSPLSLSRKQHSLSPSRRQLSLSPAPRLVPTASKVLQHVARNGTWGERAAVVKASCENVVQLLRTQRAQFDSKEQEWMAKLVGKEQIVTHVRQQLALREDEIRHLSSNLREQATCRTQNEERMPRKRQEQEGGHGLVQEWEHKLELEIEALGTSGMGEVRPLLGEKPMLPSELETARQLRASSQAGIQEFREHLLLREEGLRKEIFEQVKQVKGSEFDLECRERQVLVMLSAIEDREATVKQREEAISDREIKIHELQRELRMREERLQEDISQHAKQLEDSKSVLEDRMSALERHERQMISAMEGREITVKQREETMRDREIQVHELQRDLRLREDRLQGDISQNAKQLENSESVLEDRMSALERHERQMLSSIEERDTISKQREETVTGREIKVRELQKELDLKLQHVQSHSVAIFESVLEDRMSALERHERQMISSLEERDAMSKQREEAVTGREIKGLEFQKELDLKLQQMQSFEAMSSFREQDLQRREMELDSKEADVRESENMIVYLEKELLVFEDDIARVQHEVVTLVKGLSVRHEQAARQTQLLSAAQERELSVAVRERAVEMREDQQLLKERELQEVQVLAERYANALEIKKRELALTQLELQMKLTEIGFVS